MHHRLLAFKFFATEHDGASLAKVMIELLEDYGIAPRLLGVTADNASNNTTMLEYVETYYDEKYPDSCFSRQWNQVECMAHVLNLGAQQIFKNFKQIVDKDEYIVNSADPLVTAVSRLAFLCRKMRDVDPYY
jgi:hypothetical protein